MAKGSRPLEHARQGAMLSATVLAGKARKPVQSSADGRAKAARGNLVSGPFARAQDAWDA